MSLRLHFLDVNKLRHDAALLRIDLLKNNGDVVPRIKRLQQLYNNIIAINLHQLQKQVGDKQENSPQAQTLALYLKKHNLDEADHAALLHLHEVDHMQEAQDLLRQIQFQQDLESFEHAAVKALQQLTLEINEIESPPHEVTNLIKTLHSDNDALSKVSKLRNQLDKLVSAQRPPTDLSRFYFNHLEAIYALVFGYPQPNLQPSI